MIWSKIDLLQFTFLLIRRRPHFYCYKHASRIRSRKEKSSMYSSKWMCTNNSLTWIWVQEQFIIIFLVLLRKKALNILMLTYTHLILVSELPLLNKNFKRDMFLLHTSFNQSPINSTNIDSSMWCARPLTRYRGNKMFPVLQGLYMWKVKCWRFLIERYRYGMCIIILVVNILKYFHTTGKSSWQNQYSLSLEVSPKLPEYPDSSFRMPRIILQSSENLVQIRGYPGIPL